jgi:hypothetical protein
MRWSSWLLALFGVVFMAVGVWAWQTPGANAANTVLVQPMFIGGSILLAAGIGIMSCGWGCYGGSGGYCDCGGGGGGCGCGHCEGCKGGECCGNCGCENQSGGGHEGHSHEGHHH